MWRKKNLWLNLHLTGSFWHSVFQPASFSCWSVFIDGLIKWTREVVFPRLLLFCRLGFLSLEVRRPLVTRSRWCDATFQDNCKLRRRTEHVRQKYNLIKRLAHDNCFSIKPAQVERMLKFCKSLLFVIYYFRLCNFQVQSKTLNSVNDIQI